MLNRQHVRNLPIMRVVPIERNGELLIRPTAPGHRSGAGRVGGEVRAGLLTGLSVSFQAVRQSFAGGVRRIQSAAMTAVSLVDSAFVRCAGRSAGAARRWPRGIVADGCNSHD